MGEIKVRVKIIGHKPARNVKVSKKTTIADLLAQLGQGRETVVVWVNGRIVAEEERLAAGDSVEILPVVTGG